MERETHDDDSFSPEGSIRVGRLSNCTSNERSGLHRENRLSNSTRSEQSRPHDESLSTSEDSDDNTYTRLSQDSSNNASSQIDRRYDRNEEFQSPRQADIKVWLRKHLNKSKRHIDTLQSSIEVIANRISSLACRMDRSERTIKKLKYKYEEKETDLNSTTEAFKSMILLTEQHKLEVSKENLLMNKQLHKIMNQVKELEYSLYQNEQIFNGDVPQESNQDEALIEYLTGEETRTLGKASHPGLDTIKQIDNIIVEVGEVLHDTSSLDKREMPDTLHNRLKNLKIKEVDHIITPEPQQPSKRQKIMDWEDTDLMDVDDDAQWTKNAQAVGINTPKDIPARPNISPQAQNDVHLIHNNISGTPLISSTPKVAHVKHEEQEPTMRHKNLEPPPQCTTLHKSSNNVSNIADQPSHQRGTITTPIQTQPTPMPEGYSPIDITMRPTQDPNSQHSRLEKSIHHNTDDDTITSIKDPVTKVMVESGEGTVHKQNNCDMIAMLHKRPRVDPPDKFEGDGEKLDEFEYKYRRYCEYTNEKGRDAVELLNFRLKGDATIWYRSLTDEDKTDLDTVFKKMRERYCSSAFRMIMGEKLRNAKMRDDEHIDEYVSRFTRLGQIVGLGEKELIPQFISNVIPSLKKSLMIYDPQTLSEAFERARVKGAAQEMHADSRDKKMNDKLNEMMEMLKLKKNEVSRRDERISTVLEAPPSKDAVESLKSEVADLRQQLNQKARPNDSLDKFEGTNAGDNRWKGG